MIGLLDLDGDEAALVAAVGLVATIVLAVAFAATLNVIDRVPRLPAAAETSRA